MARALPTLFVVALLAATGAAFALTESRKLVPAPVARPQAGVPLAGDARLGPALFSPVCVCASDHVEIRFLLRRADRLTVTIRRGGRTIDTIARDQPFPGGEVRLDWNGILPSGIVAADGVYRPVVHLAAAHRTIGLPSPIRVDTSAPSVIGAEATPRLLSPDGDGRSDALDVRYELRSPGRALLFVDGRQQLRTGLLRTSGSFRWRPLAHGKPLPTGQHRIGFAAEDAAGNTSSVQSLGLVTIRYVSLGRTIVSIGPGERFYLRVSSDARRVHWLLGGRRGLARPGTIVLRAPRRTGTYRLYVWYGSHGAKAKVEVSRP